MTIRRKLGGFGASLILAVLAIVGSATGAFAEVAPDPTWTGPLATTVGEYKFDAAVDPDVLATRPTEIWGAVYRPSSLDARPYPLIVILHGNHGTCGYGESPRVDDSTMYTFTGTCPPNYRVTPNHLGYGYVAERLASWGYIVVSINANRGINAAPGTPDDLGLNKARGRLILRHLQRLSEWNRGIVPTPASLGTDLTGRLDFRHVGLIGHSRGGEGVRAAYNFYKDLGSPWPGRVPDPVTFEGIFEIGPVDGQTDRQFNAAGTAWNVLLPMCDGDVSNLQGIKPLDRMLVQNRSEDPARPKSSFTVWGTNHNYYNTEWQLSDSTGCYGHAPLWSGTIGSPEEQQVGLAAIMAFVRGVVGTGADPGFAQMFNPQFDLPNVVSSLTTVDRGYTDSPRESVTMIFEDFDRPTGTNTYGFLNDASNVTVNHASVKDHDSGDPYARRGVQRTGNISWMAASGNTYFQTNWSAPGTGRDIRDFQTLDFRVSRQLGQPTDTYTNFSIQLAMANGALTQAVPLASYTDLTGPVGGIFSNGDPNPHPILQTARISLADFGAADLSQVRGVRLTFGDSATGAINVGNVRLSKLTGLAAAAAAAARAQSAASGGTGGGTGAGAGGSSVAGIRSAATNLEITVRSENGFPIRDELVALRVGNQLIYTGSFPESGDTHQLTFTLNPDQWAQAASGDLLAIEYGGSVWATVGALDKALLDR
jgi:hypothetical protein